MKLPTDDDPFPQAEASLIFDLLRGITDDVPTDIHSRIRYLTAAEEHAGRKALAELLRTRKRPGPWRDLLTTEKREAMFNEACHRLADLIDPDNTGPQKIVFKHSKGQLPQHSANLKIFDSIQARRRDGLNVTKAVEQVAEENGLSIDWVWVIWRDYRTE
jgi:hypothetical protein